MQINLETREKHTIQSYSDSQIMANNIQYNQSLIIGRQAIFSPWPIYSVQDLTEERLNPILEMQPEVILIGHNQLGDHVPMHLIEYLSKQRIGIECMSIGAASRTFNVLLGEERAVVIGIVFPILSCV